ncbi:MAG: hypothetical protein J5786_00305 [Clostridiales bacterium]|nr:hypothetical protein [Clostridiales bacterium]
MAGTVKCPSCSGNLVFDPEKQKLVCEFCGNSYDPAEVESDEKVTRSRDEEDLKVQDERSTGNKEEMQEFICSSCGATVVTDYSTSATFCSFCGSPAIVGQKMSSEFKPDYIIPFKIGKDKAKELFLKWCGGGRMTPVSFVSEKNLEKLTGLYVPYWLFDSSCHMDRKGGGLEVIREVEFGTVYIYKNDYTVTKSGTYSWKNIPLDGETKLDDKLMEAIEPYYFEEMVPYDYKYIPGFFANRYDLKKEDLEARAKDRVKSYLDQEFRRGTEHFKTFNTSKNNDSEISLEGHYALLPVWFMNYKYLGKQYFFAMNGQTGEVAGVAPKSLVKSLIFAAMVLGVAAIAVKIIVGLILGGFLG